MTKYFIPLFVLSLTFISCNDRKEISSNVLEHKPYWNEITLKSDYQAIYIFAEKDTMISRTWHLKDSAVSPGEVWHMRTNEKLEKLYLEPSTKDSIHSIVLDMITKPVYTNQSVTCYAGNIEICVQSDNTELCCSYSSVGDWTTISINTKKLYTILSRKTKISTQ